MVYSRAGELGLQARAEALPAREARGSREARASNSWLGVLASLGAVGLLLGGLPLLAARRIIYPMIPDVPPQDLSGGIEFSGVEPQKVEFPARDGKTLGGWFVPGPDPAAAPWPCILLVHGYAGYKEQMVGYAQMVHSGGFATLMFDMAGSGLRAGEPVTLGYKERWDVLDAVRYLQTRPDVDPERLGVLGLSMGAATALLAAAEEPNIKAIVADSAYADLTDMVKPGVRTFIGAPALPLSPLIVRYAETLLGIRSGEIRPERAAARLGDRALLVIHGADDKLTDPDSAHRIYEAATGPKELWVVPYCLHGCAPMVAPEEYKRRINDFFKRHLNGAQQG